MDTKHLGSSIFSMLAGSLSRMVAVSLVVSGVSSKRGVQQYRQRRVEFVNVV